MDHANIEKNEDPCVAANADESRAPDTPTFKDHACEMNANTHPSPDAVRGPDLMWEISTRLWQRQGFRGLPPTWFRHQTVLLLRRVWAEPKQREQIEDEDRGPENDPRWRGDIEKDHFERTGFP